MGEAARNHRADMAKKDHEIDFLQASVDDMTRDYEGLLEVKIALDLEINAYRKMLEDEESRLNLSQSMEADTTDSGRGTKRKRLMEAEECSGFNITTSHTQPGQWLIEPLEEDVQCIKIRNVGEEEGSLGGYTLQSVSGGLETKYKFHRTVKVSPGEVVAVWNADAGVEHQPNEGQLVMKQGGFIFKAPWRLCSLTRIARWRPPGRQRRRQRPGGQPVLSLEEGFMLRLRGTKTALSCELASNFPTN